MRELAVHRRVLISQRTIEGRVLLGATLLNVANRCFLFFVIMKAGEITARWDRGGDRAIFAELCIGESDESEPVSL